MDDVSIPLSLLENVPNTNIPGDPTAKRALTKIFYSKRIKLIEKTAMETDPYLYGYIIKGITEQIRNAMWERYVL